MNTTQDLVSDIEMNHDDEFVHHIQEYDDGTISNAKMQKSTTIRCYQRIKYHVLQHIRNV